MRRTLRLAIIAVAFSAARAGAQTSDPSPTYHQAILIQPIWALVHFYSADYAVAAGRRVAFDLNASYTDLPSSFLDALEIDDRRARSAELKAQYFVAGTALNGPSVDVGLGYLVDERHRFADLEADDHVTGRFFDRRSGPTLSAAFTYAFTHTALPHLALSAGAGAKQRFGGHFDDERAGPVLVLHLAAGVGF